MSQNPDSHKSSDPAGEPTKRQMPTSGEALAALYRNLRAAQASLKEQRDKISETQQDHEGQPSADE